MHKFLVTVIRTINYNMMFHGIMEGQTQAAILRQLNRQYPQFCPFDISPSPDYRIYITVLD